MLTTAPFLITGSSTQLAELAGGRFQPVAGAPPGPVLFTRQRVEPWSNTQLWPPPVSGCVGSSFSFAELSGTNTEPMVPVNTPSVQLFGLPGRFALPIW